MTHHLFAFSMLNQTKTLPTANLYKIMALAECTRHLAAATWQLHELNHNTKSKPKEHKKEETNGPLNAQFRLSGVVPLTFLRLKLCVIFMYRRVGGASNIKSSH